MQNINYIKLDADDILEILLEYYQEQFENTTLAKWIILGTPENDLRFIGAFGKENDPNFNSVDLEEIDKIMDYNGDHSSLKNNPDFFIK